MIQSLIICGTTDGRIKIEMLTDGSVRGLPKGWYATGVAVLMRVIESYMAEGLSFDQMLATMGSTGSVGSPQGSGLESDRKSSHAGEVPGGK